MDGQPTWYFAYGSNMQSATFRGRRGIDPAEVRVGRVDGYALSFGLPIGTGRRGVASVRREPGAWVWGVAYLLTPTQNRRLDATEGVGRGAYHRERVDVMLRDGGVLVADTLVGVVDDPERGPSVRYLSLLVEGAREHGLPPDYVRRLETWPTVWDERPGAANRGTS